MSSTATEHVTDVVAQPEQDTNSGASPYNFAVIKVMDQLSCTRPEAEACVYFVGRMAEFARTGTSRTYDEPGIHHLTAAEMDTPGYRLMDEIMPHGKTAEPDTAHAAVEAAVLQGDEFALVHDNPTGEPSDCVVTIQIRKMD